MLPRNGMTLIEIMVVLIIVAVATVFIFPNFTQPTEQAKAKTAQNNLLAIYTAMKNYVNENNGTSFPVLTSISAIDSTLSLEIQDDGSYAYSCNTPSVDPTGFSCSAVRSTNALTLKIKNAPLQAGVNPTCTGTNLTWCP